MEMMDLYPLLVAESLTPGSENENPLAYYLFNSQTNRGFAVEGLAALFCKTMNGKKKVKELVQNFEKEHELEAGIFEKDILKLIDDMDDNGLILLSDKPHDQ